MPADFALKLARHRHQACTLLFKAAMHARREGAVCTAIDLTNVLWHLECYWKYVNPCAELSHISSSARMMRIVVYRFLLDAPNCL